ncbi:predicted protein [Naegleria gruberi]|uniref:phenylalanine--tRNA ligase n=1 Tax=Naegleria gruberi TaxID=5762 RepID=D2V102_NAEGR|nr:uncharacterized protein NAEGRDRAFT_29964 [Naegleria gruberi]EFC49819.1 predicted protein [Naegleria gruberi]|eukprot:XP_002682563.1 predicted protein [Naegleria gruberi strain NEG-M]
MINKNFRNFNTNQKTLSEVPIYVQIKESNIPPSVHAKIGRNLYRKDNHPLCIIKTIIQNHFIEKAAKDNGKVQIFDEFHPKVTTVQNFESLCFPSDHISRQPTDTYYYDSLHLLRTHTTAHQVEILQKGHEHFLVAGDVYRRDDVDATHYPVFHQMDGVKIFRKKDFIELVNTAFENYCIQELKNDLEGLARALFGDVTMRWNSDYFPFVDPGIELEIDFRGKWLEVLGCGLIKKDIMLNAKYDLNEYTGYAFGVGLERLAMILFDIPDIRLFWSEDARFLSQFSQEIVNSPKLLLNTKFKPISKFPGCYKDISMWVDSNYSDNDFYEIVRELAGDLAENVSIVDDFTHPKTGKRSKCYRIMYRSMERSLTNEEIDEIQFKLREAVPQQLPVTLR